MSGTDVSYKVFDSTLVDKAIKLLDVSGSTEDDTGRYVLNWIRQVFPVSYWSIVPQYYARSGDFLDLVLETWIAKKKEGFSSQGS